MKIIHSALLKKQSGAIWLKNQYKFSTEESNKRYD